MHEYTITTIEEYMPIIESLLAECTEREGAFILALSGDLGAGKTTFVQELAKALGITETVASPTFVIMKQYDAPHESCSSLVHIDAYRFEKEGEAAVLRLEEYASTPGTIIAIEWPERMEQYIPTDATHISFEITEGDVRKVVLT